MVGRRPTTGQRLGDAVTGDQSLEADIDVSVTCPLCFPEREASAVALASQAQETSRKHRALPTQC